MDEYLAFCILYDFYRLFDYIDLPCDETFDLCMELVGLARANVCGELYYDTLMDWLEEWGLGGDFVSVGYKMIENGLISNKMVLRKLRESVRIRGLGK